MSIANRPPQLSGDASASGAVGAGAGEHAPRVLAADPVGKEQVSASLRLLLERFLQPEPARGELEPEPVELADPGPRLSGRIEFRSEVGEAESVAWVEYQAAPAGSFAWRALARSEAAPFAALLDSAALPDGAYDMRVLVGRREGQIEGSRALRGRLVENKPRSVALEKPAPGAWVGGSVALAARISPVAAELGPLRFQFSSDGERWRSMLRAARVGPGAALWYTSGLPDGTYLLRALAGSEPGSQLRSEPVEIQLDNTPPAARLVEPARFAVLRGPVRPLAEALDAGSGVAAVEFQYARAEEAWRALGSTASIPFSLLWNTDELPDGAYRLRCVARDCLGNRATSEAVAVLVANAVLREPRPGPNGSLPLGRPPEPGPEAEPPPQPPESAPPPPEAVPPMSEAAPTPTGAAATLWQLERLVEQGASDPRRDERNALLYALRTVAAPDGTIPQAFLGLLEETFGELLA